MQQSFGQFLWKSVESQGFTELMTNMEEAVSQTVYATTESEQARSANKMGGAGPQLC